jgi:hypothetical protein
MYALMVAFDVEKLLLTSVPLFSLGLCMIGFALMEFLFVLEPSWLGATSLPWVWLIVFAIIWALGASLSGLLSWLVILSYYPFFTSQYSTDSRPQWQKMLTEPSSQAIKGISLLVGLLILIGFRAGWQMNESLQSPLKRFYSFGILLSSAMIGLFLGEIIHVVVQVVVG